MTQPVPTIARILLAVAPSGAGESVGPLSIGILTDADGLFWGDCPDATADQFPTVERLIDLSISRLRGQRLTGFRDLWQLTRPVFPERGLVPIADGVGAAVQQALLAALSAAHRRPPAEILAADYGLSQLQSPNLPIPQSPLPLYLEIPDHAATAARIDAMLGLRPAGLAYRLTGGRVVEALGENAEHLQRFVRELGQRAELLSGDDPYHPAVYLALNGALGVLAGDPVRHIGKILGNAIGLQEAAGARRLVLESPFMLDDPTALSSNLLRLKDFIRRTPSSHDRVEPVLLAAEGGAMGDEELTVYADIGAANALTFDLPAMSDIDQLMSRLAKLNAAGVDSFVRVAMPATPRWLATAVDVALAARSLGLLLPYGDDAAAYRSAARHINETAAALAM